MFLIVISYTATKTIKNILSVPYRRLCKLDYTVCKTIVWSCVFVNNLRDISQAITLISVDKTHFTDEHKPG